MRAVESRPGDPCAWRCSGEPRSAYRRIGLRVTTAAQWPVLIELLHAIEQGSPRMLVDDLQLRAPPIEMRASTQPISAAFTVLAFRSAATGASQ